MSINLQKAKFVTTLLLKTLMSSKVSFDGAFSRIVRKYELNPHEARNLYKLAYKIVTYYHGLKFMASYYGYKPNLAGTVEYLYAKGFDLEGILEEIRDVSTSLSNTSRISLLYGYPQWIVRDLYNKVPLDVLELILKSLNEKKRWLRVNTPRYSIDDAIHCLERTGLEVRQHKVFKDLLLIEDPFLKIANNPCVRNCVVIPQDISSYLSVKALEIIAGDLVDACSAPGIKLVQILSGGVVDRVISVDRSEKRAKLICRIAKAAIGDTPRLITVVGDSRTLQYNLGEALILIDAPCSNSGAIYANPAIKLHLTRRKVKLFHIVQLNLIRNNLKKGRRIVFVTCSIHPLEGEELIDKTLSKYCKSAELIKLSCPYLSGGYLGYRFSKSTHRIYPHEVQGQGFFISVLEAR